ncbi:MAG: hypothetical protein U1E65_13055 [Myxococcota bacterium]
MARLAAPLLALIFCCLGGACQRRVFLEPPWSAGQVGVVGLADARGEASGTQAVLSRGADPIQLRHEDNGPLRVWAAAFDEGAVDFDHCSPRVEVNASLGVHARQTWLSAPFSAGDAKASWSESALSFGVGFDCLAPSDRCADGTVETLDFGETAGDALQAVAISHEALWILVDGAEVDGFHALLSRYDAQGRHDQPNTTITGGARALFLDDNSLYGSTDVGWVFRRDLRTGTTAAARIAAINWGSWRTPDGFWFARTGRPPSFVELVGTSTRPLDRFPGSLRVIAASAKDRMFAGDELGFLLRYDGQAWIPEHQVPGAPEFSAIALGTSGALVIPRYGNSWKSGPAGQWTEIPQAPITFPAAAGVLSRDRAIVVGAAGGIAVLVGGRFCTLASGTTAALTDVSVAPSGEVAWVVGKRTGPGEPATLLRVRMP